MRLITVNNFLNQNHITKKTGWIIYLAFYITLHGYGRATLKYEAKGSFNKQWTPINV